MGRTANRLALATLCVAVALGAAACAAFGPRPVPSPCEGRLETLFPPPTAGVELTGKVRLDLPRYRLRGLCRILSSGEGLLRIDFRHSSLFGAVSEDVTIVAGDALAICDREEGIVFESDSSLAFLRRSVGEAVEPDDLLYALLLAVPRCADMGMPGIEESGSRWKVSAGWRDRRVEIRGKREEGPREFEQCFADGARCFLVSYDRYDPADAFRYPRRIRLSKIGGAERITLELIDIKLVTTSPDMFDLDAAAPR